MTDKKIKSTDFYPAPVCEVINFNCGNSLMSGSPLIINASTEGTE